MDRELIIRLAVQAGITPWAKNEWSKDRFVQTDEGMDGDAACLIQFAALVAAHEREECAKAIDDSANICVPGPVQTVLREQAKCIRSRT